VQVVYLSYHPRDPVGFWVREFFSVELENRLSLVGVEIPVVGTESVPAGEHTDHGILANLLATVIFIPVLSGNYLRNKWSPWEWACIHQLRPDRAIIPVQFSDTKRLSADIRSRKPAVNFEGATGSTPAWKNTTRYEEVFVPMVQSLAELVADRIDEVGPPKPPPNFEPPRILPPMPMPVIEQRRTA
jgi:hypothetical protein